MMKRYSITGAIIAPTLSLLSALFVSCTSADFETFENKTFSPQNPVEQIFLRSDDEKVGVIKTAMAQPASETVSVSYVVSPELLATYKEEANEPGAQLLEEKYYKIENARSVIPVGRVTGSDVLVSFQSLSELDRDQVYVLPLSISESTIEVLKSRSRRYFVFRGAALINTVGNISQNYLSHIGKGKVGALELRGDFTAEALVRVDKFGKLISTIMGVEGGGLIRIGDAGLPDNQIQFAGPRGNATNRDWVVPTGEWTHIALTFTKNDDFGSGSVRVYINGVDKGVGDQDVYANRFDWGSTYDFFIGKSYDNGRYLDGDISEVRVWNRVLTPEEINAKNHFYTVAPDAEGLIAYWKFDEAEGKVIKDHTANGNDLQAKNPIVWKAVELPTK